MQGGARRLALACSRSVVLNVRTQSSNVNARRADRWKVVTSYCTTDLRQLAATSAKVSQSVYVVFVHTHKLLLIGPPRYYQNRV